MGRFARAFRQGAAANVARCQPWCPGAPALGALRQNDAAERVRREQQVSLRRFGVCAKMPVSKASHNRSVKSEAPLLIDGDEYLNAAYLCADFTHINGELDEGGDSPTFPTPIAVLSSSPVAMGADDDGDPADATAAAASDAAVAGQHHAIGAHLEEAVLRMVDIISNAVLSRRDNNGTAATGAGAVAAVNGAVSSNVTTSSPDAEDKSGNEPFLEYVRHYLRHTTLANNMELKRLVTQFMHSNPNSGD